MKTTIIALVASGLMAVAGSAFAAPVKAINLVPNRAAATATLLSDGSVLVAGGVNESGTLDSVLLYQANGSKRGKFFTTGSLTTPRADHTATLLPDGRVLVTGGDLLNGQLLKSAETYDTTSGTWTQISQAMSVGRSNHTATLLPDGRVLIVGGKKADLFDPSTNTFTTTANDPVNRKSHAAILLPNGTVLITGGYVGKLATTSAEIFDPSTNMFTVLANSMLQPRANHTMNLLPNGLVLIAGGFSGTSPHDECDYYNPATQVFTSAPAMNYHRSGHRAISLPDGTVVVIGGTTLESGFLSINEEFDPTAQTWTVLRKPMNEDRSNPTATLLQDGTILVAGGVTGNVTLQSAEVLDPVTQTFTSLPNMTAPRNQQTATLLPNGRVLIAAGSTDATTLTSAEEFDPVSNTFNAVGSLSTARKSHAATLMNTGQVLVAGGKTGTGDTKSAEIYDPATQQFRTVSDMITGRSQQVAELLQDGRVLEAAGRHGGLATPNSETFDPTTEQWTAQGPLNLGRQRSAGAVLLDGTVLVAGGATGRHTGQPDGGTPTCELFNPSTGLWTYTQNMHTGRQEFDATLLTDGTVLEAGGYLLPNSPDLYQPGTQSFTSTQPLVQDISRNVDIRLSNPAWGALQNKVLVIGGSITGSSVYGGLNQAVSLVQLYDPATQQFSTFGNMLEARQNHTATMLNDGRILVTGGVSTPSISGTAEIVKP